jgi:ABC-type dipeptide/oligopeptide/nickel transport system permease component
MIGASLLIWAIMPLAPGDPARRILQAQGVVEPTGAEIERMRAELHLNKPFVQRYGLWVTGLARGDFGLSWQTGKPVAEEFLERLPATVTLALTAFGLAALVAIPAGILAVKWHHRWPDGLLRLIALCGAASPSFLIALLCIHFVIIGMGWGRVVLDGGGQQVFIPAAVLAVDMSATWSRLLRASLLEIMGRRFISTAAARGASPHRMLLVHATPNAVTPLLHAMGLSFGALLGGAIIVETIFTWPGLGRYVVEAITARDLPVVQAYAVFSTVCFVSASLFTDFISSLMDPRIARQWG